jgi:alanine dehydrogenase
MTLIINNDEVAQVLTMETTMAALEEAYLALAAREAVCRPRIDIRIPTADPGKNYQWGTMEGGSTAGYFAIRMKSDVIYETQYNGSITQEKYCLRPGLYCGLILLTSIETAEPLAFINDGHLQHMRVGADGGIGVKYLAKQDAEVVGVLGSGGMARTHMRAFTLVRNIKKLQVFSPTREHREQFGRDMAARYNIEVAICDRPEDVYKGADIVAGLTDSAVPVLDGTLLENGVHIVNVGGSGKPAAGRRLPALWRYAGSRWQAGTRHR